MNTAMETTETRARTPGKTIIMSERRYRKIVWRLAMTFMLIGYFVMLSVYGLLRAYGMDDGNYPPVWLSWAGLIGLPIAGNILIRETMKGN